ncbi:MAG: hypothetical protein AAGJ31_07555 [Verrucomicrobiota bacterium]
MNEVSPTPAQWRGAFFRLFVAFFLSLLALRIPGPLFLKLGVALLILSLGWRWISRSHERSSRSNRYRDGLAEESRRNYSAAIEHYQVAMQETSRINHIAVRLLACLHAAGEVGKAKALIEKMDGHEIPDSVAGELEDLVAHYYPAQLQRTPNGHRLKLFPYSES